MEDIQNKINQTRKKEIDEMSKMTDEEKIKKLKEDLFFANNIAEILGMDIVNAKPNDEE